ncbi:phytanoyl-CoA dioxygenase family protein [Pseudomonadales bacterium]|nr:phytanoyl-CoA dioxygenase family protein [Pseudomonadales bacterium]MDC1315302.1 phytanoyl-CoA dioxygenase family protein [Pseudomonadales bacterium]
MDSFVRLKALYDEQGDQDYIGEPVSQREHALQAAAHARASGAPEAAVLAALLHDVGHLQYPKQDSMAGFGTRAHEVLGAHFLASLGFSATVSALVQRHVDAKRYQVARSETYRAGLSQASQQTLHFQGGAMTLPERQAFEADPHFELALRVRHWDELAKAPRATVPEFEAYEAQIQADLKSTQLTGNQIAEFKRSGYLVIPQAFDASFTALWLNELQAMIASQGPQRWMTYFEASGTGLQCCRVEHFLEDAPRLQEVLAGNKMMGWVAQCLEAPGILFKEKINLKLAGGQGFAAHQDAPAFDLFGQSQHVTVMVSLEAGNERTGCLEVAQVEHCEEILPMNADRTLTDPVIESLTWQSIETAPGDIVIFSSFLPHRSGVNQSLQSRRAVYATYAKASEGDHRAEYFRQKRALFPPDAEREAGRAYDGGIFNVGNPIR